MLFLICLFVMEDQVVLVNEYDEPVGLAGKMAAHQNGGRLHRAISIFIFNKKGETMLQQRADSKYHSPGLWTNTTCGHPLPDESPVAAAHRKLQQEMGFDCEMYEAFSFTYQADVGNGLMENEFDHVIFGMYEKDPVLNPHEAKNWKWMNIYALKKDLKKNPMLYTPWLKLAIGQVIEHYAGTAGEQKRSSSGFGK